MSSPARTASPAQPAPPGSTPGSRRGGRGGGRGRGRGREREQAQRPAATTERSADAEGTGGGRGAGRGSGKRRGGGTRATPTKPRAARGHKVSGGGGGGPAAQKKLLVRNIPHAVTEEEARAALEAAGVARESVWRFVPGKSHGKNRAPTPARAYLDVKKSAAPVDALIAALDGQAWPPRAAGTEDPPATKATEPQLALEVALAPYQKIPRDKARKDAKVGSIDRDPEFLAFLEELSKPKERMPSADVVADSAEGEQADKPVAALVKYMNERKPRDKSKGKAGKADKSAGGRRQGGRKKEQKGAGGKDKSKKERLKKKKGDADPSTAGGQAADAAKARKLRSNKSAVGKKEASKSEPAVQPGAVRIMTPKDASARSSGSASCSTAAGAGGGDAGASDKLSQGRGHKGGGRGRGRKEGKAGEVAAAAAGSTDSSGKPGDNSKAATRPRREPRGNAGQGAKSNGVGSGGAKGDKKKRVFAPKADATGAV